MTVTQVLGAKLQPTVAKPIEWNDTRTYEPLTYVMHEGDTYITDRYVPVGIALDNEAYWTRCASFSGQIEGYREEVANYVKVVNTFDNRITDIQLNLIKSYTKVYESVVDMKTDDSLLSGMIVKTLAYHANSTIGGALYLVKPNETANEIDKIQLNNNLVAVLLTKNAVYTSQLGLTEDVSDASLILNRGINLALNNHLKLIVQPGTFTVKNQLSVNIADSFGFIFEGSGKFATVIKNDFDSNNKILVTVGSNVTIKDIGFLNECAINHPIILKNGNTRQMINCYISCASGISKEDIGVSIENDSNFTGPTFLSKIENCRFNRITLSVYSTDSYFINNEFWGNERNAALILGQCSNSLISGNEFVSGITYGSIVFSIFKQEGVRILNNYFDGSYEAIPNSNIIQAASPYQISDCLIENNIFWHVKATAIAISGNNTIISGNSFNECDYEDKGVPDIYIDGNNSYSIIISNNCFTRETTRSNKSKPINIVGSPIAGCAVNGNTCTFTSLYVPCDLPSNTITSGNVTNSLFNVTS